MPLSSFRGRGGPRPQKPTKKINASIRPAPNIDQTRRTSNLGMGGGPRGTGPHRARFIKHAAEPALPGGLGKGPPTTLADRVARKTRESSRGPERGKGRANLHLLHQSPGVLRQYMGGTARVINQPAGRAIPGGASARSGRKTRTHSFRSPDARTGKHDSIADQDHVAYWRSNLRPPAWFDGGPTAEPASMIRGQAKAGWRTISLGRS